VTFGVRGMAAPSREQQPAVDMPGADDIVKLVSLANAIASPGGTPSRRRCAVCADGKGSVE